MCFGTSLPPVPHVHCSSCTSCHHQTVTESLEKAREEQNKIEESERKAVSPVAYSGREDTLGGALSSAVGPQEKIGAVGSGSQGRDGEEIGENNTRMSGQFPLSPTPFSGVHTPPTIMTEGLAPLPLLQHDLAVGDRASLTSPRSLCHSPTNRSEGHQSRPASSGLVEEGARRGRSEENLTTTTSPLLKQAAGEAWRRGRGHQAGARGMSPASSSSSPLFSSPLSSLSPSSDHASPERWRESEGGTGRTDSLKSSTSEERTPHKQPVGLPGRVPVVNGAGGGAEEALLTKNEKVAGQDSQVLHQGLAMGGERIGAGGGAIPSTRSEPSFVFSVASERPPHPLSFSWEGSSLQEIILPSSVLSEESKGSSDAVSSASAGKTDVQAPASAFFSPRGFMSPQTSPDRTGQEDGGDSNRDSQSGAGAAVVGARLRAGVSGFWHSQGLHLEEAAMAGEEERKRSGGTETADQTAAVSSTSLDEDEERRKPCGADSKTGVEEGSRERRNDAVAEEEQEGKRGPSLVSNLLAAAVAAAKAARSPGMRLDPGRGEGAEESEGARMEIAGKEGSEAVQGTPTRDDAMPLIEAGGRTGEGRGVGAEKRHPTCQEEASHEGVCGACIRVACRRASTGIYIDVRRACMCIDLWQKQCGCLR